MCVCICVYRCICKLAWAEKNPIIANQQVYRKTGRVVFAEGLYRECLKLCGFPTDAASITDDRLLESLPSFVNVRVPGLAAWRLAQLLSALPNRGTEAARFARLAKGLVDTTQLGELDAITGADKHKGIAVPILSLWTMGIVFWEG